MAAGFFTQDKFKNYLKDNKIKTSLANGNEKFILEEALKKRNELLKNYKFSKSKVNPLILKALATSLISQFLLTFFSVKIE